MSTEIDLDEKDWGYKQGCICIATEANTASPVRNKRRAVAVKYYPYSTFRSFQRQMTLHGVRVITKLYFAIFAAFKESMTLNLAQMSFNVIHFGGNRMPVYDLI